MSHHGNDGDKCSKCDSFICDCYRDRRTAVTGTNTARKKVVEAAREVNATANMLERLEYLRETMKVAPNDFDFRFKHSGRERKEEQFRMTDDDGKEAMLLVLNHLERKYQDAYNAACATLQEATRKLNLPVTTKRSDDQRKNK